ncbi:putative oxidoreductase [Zancudomyces culisetae]|uniref:Putative oxidoreductase n=1 Tax=Zancudomyces culisetae TaxID=1213189 RepID=A0A1R1PJ42_ZANCU|nr:putative oxidoreductase [Zancudomyces culisetae]|eukprot:OMH80990.1 putative oxidoreductase [Zancudomyces culisetae]
MQEMLWKGIQRRFINKIRCDTVIKHYSTDTFSLYSRLRNKNVFITGATSGIGQACAYNYAHAGANLIISGRRTERLEAISNDIKSKYPSIKVIYTELDVRNKSQIDKAVSALPKDFKNVDILVNNAGLVIGLDKLVDTKVEDIDTMIDTNVKGLVYVTQAILPTLKRTQGHIVNIGSIAGENAYPNGSIYCASKHAVRAITQSLRCELIDTDVRITEINPGMVETEFSVVRFRGDEAKAKDVYRGIEPLKAQDIAELVLFSTSRPKHVEIATMTVFPHGQASATLTHRK